MRSRFPRAAACMLALAFGGCVGRIGDVTPVDGSSTDAGADVSMVRDVTLPDGGCTPGSQVCGGACTDTQNDSANCGACGHACGSGMHCASGACATSCAVGQMLCAGACTNTQSDNANCGGCGSTCPSGQVCSAGHCSSTCSMTVCGGPSGNVCVDLQTDTTHCGSCTRACAAGESCVSGMCQLVCASGQIPCGGRCVATSSDPANCGSCGHACAAGQVCSGGACGCAAGRTACGATCVDTASDSANCGSCGHACAAGESCSSGACACPAGQTACGAGCVSTSTDTANCGSCGHACAAGQTCSGGTCMGGSTCSSCPSGWTCMSGTCVWTDMLNAVNAARAMSRVCGMYGSLGPSPPLTWNAMLTQSALGHSMVMASTPCFSHDGTGSTPCPDGNPCTRITATGYTWSAYGENIAAGQPTLTDVMNAWLMSPGHCRNIMDSMFTEMGAAVVMGGPYGIYWTQNFGTPGSAGPSSCP